MVRNLSGKRILITGASSGIGYELGLRAARRGARVALTARSADKLEELAKQIRDEGGEAFVVPGDLVSEADRAHIVDATVAHYGGLDVLVNNAGVASFGHFADSSEEILRTVMEVNFFAPIELTRLAIPHLQQGIQPAVVNVASMCGRRGMPAWSEYSASKFGLCGMSEALRGELARFDIDVLLIIPGLTSSRLSEHLLRNTGRMNIEHQKGMSPEFVADAILDAIEKNRAETILGSEARWILRMHKFFPRLLDRLIIRRVKKLYQEPAS
ncbi:MAG: hypothetical protein KatS3mg105_3867 [Gemmatales bacterium]|nr:MAG: hypothetical protein KatS3mg105_3867 [Gemmatales bacterium]